MEVHGGHAIAVGLDASPLGLAIGREDVPTKPPTNSGVDVSPAFTASSTQGPPQPERGPHCFKASGSPNHTFDCDWPAMGFFMIDVSSLEIASRPFQWQKSVT